MTPFLPGTSHPSRWGRYLPHHPEAPLRCRAIGQRCPGSPQSCPGVSRISRIIGPICINHGKQDESGWIRNQNGDGSKPWYRALFSWDSWIFIPLKMDDYRYWPIPKWPNGCSSSRETWLNLLSFWSSNLGGPPGPLRDPWNLVCLTWNQWTSGETWWNHAKMKKMNSSDGI